MFEKKIYTAKPAGNCQVKTANIIGIIQSIISWVCCCLGSVDGDVVNFCCINIDNPTIRGRANCHGVGANCTKSTKSIPIKLLSNGTLDIEEFQE